MSSPLPFEPVPAPSPTRESRQGATVVLVAFAFACLLSIAAFPDAWQAMVRVWTTSETFAHGFIALPCAAWMIWRRRDDWAAMPRRTCWPAVALLAVSGLVWLAGRLGGVASIEQFGAVSVIPATVLLIAGVRITRTLAFPLAFLYFAVPVGEFLTPIMMNYTADATVTALRWTGVPVYREGLHFTLPTGSWSVVEACSGLRYLIASLALGVLYAYLQFRTLKYRLYFVALSIVVPIVANWIRAYMIVMLGHLSDMRIATGADHLIYGWLFFGLVMALLFWIGTLWREPAPASAKAASPADTRAHPGAPQALRPAAIAAVVAALAVLAWRPLSGVLLDSTRPIDVVPALQAAVAGFPQAPALDFTPRYSSAYASVRASRRIDDEPVELHAYYFARQYESQEMIHADNGVVRVDDREWTIRSRGVEPTPWGTVATYRLGRPGHDDVLVWHWYAVGATQTANAYVAKAATAWSLGTGHGDHSLAVVLATPVRVVGSASTSEALSHAAQRLRTMADALDPTVVAIAHGRAMPSVSDAALPRAPAPATSFDAPAVAPAQGSSRSHG